MKNTDFINFQVLRKFTENSSSACYEVASDGKWQLETNANYSGEYFTKLERDLIKAHFKTVLAQHSFPNKHGILVTDQHSNCCYRSLSVSLPSALHLSIFFPFLS